MMDYEELVDHADELRNHVAEAGIPYMQVAIVCTTTTTSDNKDG